MAQAIVLRAHGAPKTLKLERIDVGEPAADELRIRQTAIGVNFHDVYVRSGLYRTLPLPGTPGIEGVGVIEAIGPDVDGFAVGDRIGYVSGQYGAYASERILPARLALRLPDTIDDHLAATILLKGLTAEMLVQRVQKIERGMTVLVHAAAGGVGRLLCQWLTHLGAIVIGTVGSEAKEKIALEAGCRHAILYRTTDFVDEVRRITGGRGVDVVYDSVGKDTFNRSLAALAKLGHLVNFGQASGPVEPLEMSRLAAKSNSVTRPIVFHYLEDGERMREMSRNLFDAFSKGILSAEAGRPFSLADAASAHETLETRTATGPLLLIPNADKA